MKKILWILLLLPFCMAGCRKDPSEKPGGTKSYEGYIIAGKMKNVIVTDGGIDHPYILVLMADNKAKLASLEGESILNYSVEKDKIILSDNGYFNLKDGQITDWVIAGLNITTATLTSPPAINQLKGKKFSGSVKYTGFNFTLDTEVNFSATTNEITYPGADPQTFSYTPYGGVAGFAQSADKKANLFFMVDGSNLLYQSYSQDTGIGTGTLLLK